MASRVWGVVVGMSVLVTCSSLAQAEDKARAPQAGKSAAVSRSVPELLSAFSSAWPSGRTDYRTPGDESWKAYAITLRDLVTLGAQGVPEIRKGLSDENRQVRAMCARALGYLKAADAVPDLARTLSTDAWPTARLLAAKSLGMIHTPEALEALGEAHKTEKSQDVKLHVGTALERKSGREPSAVASLLQIDAKALDSAAVGQLAPDFKLEDPDGKRVALSDYRGKKTVVLVFFYGDG